MDKLSVKEFVERSHHELELSVVAGRDGLETQFINSERIQKLGLALSGYHDYIHSGRIQMVGKSEISFLNQLSPGGREVAVNALDPTAICCFLLTKGLEPPEELVKFADVNLIPVVQTPAVSSRAISLVTEFLQKELAPEITLHGVLLEMYGIGVLLLGESGIGKSECALDLITRGHRLVSDDAVRIKRAAGRLEGAAPELTAEHLEIHGLGILNVRELFGVSSICEKIRIDLCIDLVKWDEIEHIERIGLEMRERVIFEVPTPQFILPVSSGRNLSTLLETAVRVFLLRRSGHDAAQQLVDRHAAMMAESR